MRVRFKAKWPILDLFGCLKGLEVGQCASIMVHSPSMKCLRVIWSFSAHHIGHLVISSSGCSDLGNSEVITLNACCG